MIKLNYNVIKDLVSQMEEKDFVSLHTLVDIEWRKRHPAPPPFDFQKFPLTEEEMRTAISTARFPGNDPLNTVSGRIAAIKMYIERNRERGCYLNLAIKAVETFIENQK